ncbi:MAG: VWA domain-containing protein, partial [Planctomycetota bacterium]
MNIHAVHFWPLLLLPLLGVFLLLSRRSLAGGVRSRPIVSFILRTVVFLLLLLACMDIHMTEVADELAVIFLLDKSQSIPAPLREKAVHEMRMKVAEMEEGNRAGLVVFGSTASIETVPEVKPELSRIASVVQTDHTDIGSAIRLALAAFPQGVQRRIVLLSDGNQNLGDALKEARNARANGAVVDVIPLTYTYGREVRLEKIVAPGRALREEAVPIRLVVHASEPGAARLYFRVDGAIVATRDVELQTGKNIFTMEHVLKDPGFHTLEAQVECAGDGLPQNNHAFAYTIVGGDPRVLVVENQPEDARFLISVFAESGVDTRTVSPAESPVTPAEFQNWDAVVLSNVEAGAFSAEQLRSMEAAVRHLGMGLIMVGGQHSFGAGDYNGTPVEDALPVFCEVKQKEILPNGAIVLIMHTCEFADGNLWGRRICKDAVGKLTAEDLVGLVYYDHASGCVWLFPLRRAAPKDELYDRIDKMCPGDMPGFNASLQMAYAALDKASAGLKHVVIVSDGDPQPPGGLLRSAYAKSRITISTVCISPHPGDQNARTVMRSLATATGGRAYFPTDPAQL